MIRLLLDTHIFLWLANGDSERISKSALKLINDPKNVRLVSAMSCAECEHKYAIGKLIIPETWEIALKSCGAQWLDFNAAHAMALRKLPMLHRDPFDRMLIAQALVEDLTFITHDDEVLKYPIKTLRA